MIEVTPTRSVVLEMKEDRRAMQDGYVFLDEKCLLLAGEILRELVAYRQARDELLARHDAALRALGAALGRHGLDHLGLYPAPAAAPPCVERRVRNLMGVRLQDAQWCAAARPHVPTSDPSAEAEACRTAFERLLQVLPDLAARAGNLERLDAEYRRCVRRARALQDVLLPELDGDLAGIESRLEELEQEEAVALKRGA